MAGRLRISRLGRSQRGPRNFARDTSMKVPKPRAVASRARAPRLSPSRGSAGYAAPGGAGGGIPKTTTAMASNPSVVNKPKSGPKRSARLGKPRADFPSHI